MCESGSENNTGERSSKAWRVPCTKPNTSTASPSIHAALIDLVANTSTRYYKYVAGSNRLQVIRIGRSGGSLGNRSDYLTQTSIGSSPNRLKYTGREDDGTGVYYYRARYYDPQLGRFLSEDPLGFQAGINFYAYVANNPVNANDPSGLDAYMLGASIRIPWTGVGFDVGGLVTGLPFLPETTPENFDVGVYSSLSSGGLTDVVNYLTGNESAPKFSSGIDFGKLTIDAGIQWAGRESLNGASAELFTGAYAWGGTLSFDPAGNHSNPSIPSDFPTGFTLNYGPQARAGYSLSAGQSLTLGDIFTGAFEAIDWATGGGFSGVGGSSSASGGFLIYPNKPNTNIMTRVYTK